MITAIKATLFNTCSRKKTRMESPTLPLFPFEPTSDLRAKLAAVPVTNKEQLEDAVYLCRPSRTRKPLHSLHGAVVEYEKYMNTKAQGSSGTTTAVYSFYEKLYPRIVELACVERRTNSIPMLYGGRAGKATLTRGDCARILANSFFGNLNHMEDENFGILDWWGLMVTGSWCRVSLHRLVCLLAYLDAAAQWSESEMDEEVKIERIKTKATADEGIFMIGDGCEEELVWGECDMLAVDATHTQIRVHSGRMEDSGSDAFVDFANKRVHIGQVIGSATQEEVLFSACPEAFVSLLNLERLRDNEAAIIRNVRRVCDYRGYLRSFTFDGRYTGPRPVQDILVIDACEFAHFTPYNVTRDLNKAAMAFEACTKKETAGKETAGDTGPVRVATGHWGCGIFGGDKTAKFLQQVCAARVVGVCLDYSTFNDEPTKRSFEDLLARLAAKRVTVGQIYTWLIQGGRVVTDDLPFSEYVKRQLDQMK
eukprot:GDKI01006436.1.p1 GENE.GDKI01006436.1~~GDKI01006436.1.p1  ORF type:complete len:480 (-),score=117.30 GDKI01006436.1:329-1768(-)